MSDVAEQFRLLDGMSTEEFHKLIEAEKMGGSATEQTGALFNCLTQGAPMNAIKGALAPEPVQSAESWASTYCTPGPSGFYPPPASASNYPTPTSAYVQNPNPAAPYYYQYPPEWGQNPTGPLAPYQAQQAQGQVPPSPAAPPPQPSTSSLATAQPAGPPPLTALLQLLVMRICKDRPTTQIIETIIPLLMEHQKDLTYTEPPSGINTMLMSAIERLANAPPPPPEPARPAPPPRRSRVRERDSDDSLSVSELSIFSSDSSTSESSSTSLETRRRRKHRNRSSKKKRQRTPSPPPKKQTKKKKQSEARDDRKKKSRRKEKGRRERSTSSRSSSSRSSSSSSESSSSSVAVSQHSTPRKPGKASKQPAETPPMTAPPPPPEPKTIQTPPKAKSRFSLFKKDPDAAARKKEQKEQKAAEKAALKAQKQADKAARKATKSVRVSSPVKVDPPSLSEAGSDGSDESEAPSEQPSPPPKKATAPDPDPVEDESGSGDSDDDDDTDAKCRAATRRAKALQEAAEEAKEQEEQESKKKKGRFSLLGGKGAAKPKEASEEGTWFASAGTRAHFAWAVYVISTRLSETTERDSEKQFPHRFVKEKVYETSPIQWQGRCSVLSPIFVKAAYPTDGTDTTALISSLADCLKFWPNEELMGPKVWKYVGKTGAKGSLDGLIETLPEGKPGTWAAHGWRHLVFCMNSAAKSHATSSPYLAQFFALSLCPPSWKPKDVKKNSVKIAAFLTAIAGSGADVERPDRCPQP